MVYRWAYILWQKISPPRGEVMRKEFLKLVNQGRVASYVAVKEDWEVEKLCRASLKENSPSWA